MYKRILCLFLTFAMVFGMMPISVSAVERELNVNGNEVEIEEIALGPKTLTHMVLYKQTSFEAVAIECATQDGNVINITIPEDTDPNALLQVGFIGTGTGNLSYSGNKFALSNGAATISCTVFNGMAMQTYGSTVYTINISIPKGDPCTVTKPEGAGFTFVGSDSAYIGSSYSFQIQVDEGYDGSEMVVMVNGEVLEAVEGIYIVPSVSEELVIEVEGVVKKEVSNVTLIEGEGYAISGDAFAYINEAYSFTVTPDTTYYKTAGMRVLLDGETELTGENGSYSFVPVNDVHEITVEGIEKKALYTVTKPEVEGITFTGADTVLETDRYTFNVAVDEAYDASAMIVTVNGEEVTLEKGSYTIEAADSDIIIEITGVVKKVISQVTLTQADGYTISSSDVAYLNEDYSFTVKPDSANYKTAGMRVLLDGETELTGVNGSYSFVPVNDVHEITVAGIEKKALYTVTKPEMEGITFTGADTVLETDTYTFRVSVDEAYDAAEMVVKVNGESVEGTDGAYTLENVSGNLEITVDGLVKKNVLNVIAPVGNGFTFTGAETVYEGSSYTFTVAVNTGYSAKVFVNGQEITGTNGSYTVEAVSEDLVITVQAERAPLPEKELTVTDNVIDITDNKFANMMSSVYATATNIKIEGADIKEAYEDGKNVYIILEEETADSAALSVTFGISSKTLSVSGHTAKVSLNNGDGAVAMKLDGKIGNKVQGSATYNLIFFRYIPSTEPPVCVETEGTAQTWKKREITIDLTDYFEDAETYYLVNGENRTQLEGDTFTYVPELAGEQQLVFAAANRNGDCPDTLTITLEVMDVAGGIYIGYTTSKGSVDTVTFTDGEGNPIDGIDVSYETKKITVILPMDFALDGTVKAVFTRTANGDNYPRLSSSSAFNQGDGSWTDTFSNKLSNGFATRNAYLYNQKPGATAPDPETIVISYSVRNELPVLAEGIEATAEATITAGKYFNLDLLPLFTDADGDELTYFVSVGGAAAVAADANYSYTTDTAGEYTLVFTAHDGRSSSVQTYTVKLTVENMAQTTPMTAWVPVGLEPKFYVCTGFDGTGTDILDAAVEAVAGETVDGLTAYSLSYPSNAKQLSIRTEAWGGMAFAAEEDGIVSVRSVQMSAVDYKGDPAQITGSVSYNGHTAFGGEEGWLLVTGEEYTYCAVPVDASLASVTVAKTLEANAETLKLELELMIKDPVTITVSTGAKAELYQIDTSRYYAAKEIEAKLIKDNEDGTITYYYSASGNDLVYHVSMEGKISKAGYFEWNQKNINAVYTDADQANSYRLDDYSASGEENSGIAEDSVVLNVNSRNHLSLSVGESKTLKAYRIWEIIKISYQNYILTPDFTYTVLAGKDVVSLTPKDSPSTANGDWMTLTALKEGIAIIEVSYDAMQTTGGSYDGIYGASDPNRTGLVVVQVGGKNDTTVDFGIESFASAGISGSQNISYNPNAKRAWDVEFDTLYFTEEAGTLKLSPVANSDITQVAVSNDKGNTWTTLNADNGVYTATIVPGNNVIRVTTLDGVAYQVVRGDRVNVVLNEIDGSSDGDGIVEAGEGIRVTLVGLHMPIPKMAGNYNPGYYGNTDGFSSVHLNYSNNGTPVHGPGTQYNFITAANYVELTMPEDGSAVTLDNGYIGVGVLGLQNFTTGGDSHRNIPDAGCTTRDTKTTYHTRSILPVITIQAGGESAPNTAPAVKANALTTGEIFDDQKFAINPESLFFDADEDVLNYTVSVNGGEAVSVGAAYKFEPDAAGVYTLMFTASDKEAFAQHTVIVTVKERPAPEEEKNEFGLTESEIAGWVSVSFEDNGIRVKGETGLKYPEALGTIIEATRVPFRKGETVAQVTIRLLDYMKIGYEYSGTPEKGFYLGAIKNFEVDHTPYDVMGEFDAGTGSGWMITLNDVFINKGASDFKVADSDIIRWQYTCQLGADIGDTYDKDVVKVKEMIDAIGTVSLDSQKAIEAARAAYEALTEAQKTAVTNYEKLTAAEDALEQLKLAVNDQTAADAVKEKINAIGTVTLASEEKITAARSAYEALTAAQKDLVSNYETLTKAEAILEQMKQANAGFESIYKAVGDYLESLGTPSVNPIGGEWMVLGLVRSGRAVPSGYYDEVIKYVRENINDQQQLHRAKSTENSRVILALTAAGYDVTDVDGHNLLEGLASMSYVKKQGNNGAIWALIAFDSFDYEIPQGDVSTQALIDAILATQLADGGWSMSSVATSGDSDLTAMAIQALAPYYNSNAAVKAAVDKALALLAKMQLSDGSYGSVDGSCAESTAQVIVALCAMGIDPSKDSRFIKNGNNTVDALLRFYVNGEGFRHTPNDKETNGMATEQGYYALTAYDRFLKGKTFLYDMTDLKGEEKPAPHVHSFGKWTVVEEAKIRKEGLEERLCTCGEKESRAIAKLAFPFTDVKETSYAYDTVAWAVDEEITSGMTVTTFVPDGEVTRGQVVTFLWRAAGSPKATQRTQPFTDVEEGRFYYEAVLWAVENGITSGRTATSFAPKDTCTRGEVVTFLWRFAGKPDVSKVSNPFSDLEEGRFYSDAVLWAVNRGITAGVTKTTFGPEQTCKRAQIVTFLFRYMDK